MQGYASYTGGPVGYGILSFIFHILNQVILIANIFQMGNAVIYFQNLFRRNLLVNCA
ncbi:hypothetical protein KSF78_0002128 [Schistosoma japonicum]|nr:hypothetical protein KSF78_0002128 [Schistosoma japonicum]